MKRHLLLKAAVLGMLSVNLAASAANPIVDVYKSESCGCCSEWIKHLEANGFTVKARNVPNPSYYREKLGMPDELGSCPTGFIQGYALEGHVPANEIKRLIADKLKAKGLAVRAMPLGSPGMEGPRNDPYDVLLVKADGKVALYKHYN